MASSVAAPTGVAVGHPKAKFTRVAALGFALMSSGMLLWIVGGVIAGQSLGGETMFLVVGAVVPLIAGALVWRFRTVGKAVGAVLAFLALGAMFWVAFSLGAPSAFVEFSGAVMWVLGGLTALGCSIAAIVKRHDLRTEATGGELRAMRIIVGVVALAMVVSGILNVTTRTTVEASAAAGATPATMSNFKFTPATYEATAETPTQFLVHNSDAFTHDFAIDALGVSSGLLTPGSKTLVEVNAPAGEYLIRCTLHSGSSQDPAEAGEGMTALLTVK